MSWDTALVGVIIGSVLTILGNFTSQWLNIRKETKQWEREQEIEDRRRNEETRMAEQRAVAEIYQECISNLSLIAAQHEGNFPILNEELLNIYRDTLRSLAILAVHRRDLPATANQSLQDSIASFARAPDMYLDPLLAEVKRLAATDPIIGDRHAHEEVKRPSVRQIHISIDDGFRRQSMVEGRIVPKECVIDCDLLELTQSQRDKLWDLNFNGIPPHVILYVPVPDAPQKGGREALKQWKAELDPTRLSAKEIIDAWELAYNSALG